MELLQPARVLENYSLLSVDGEIGDVEDIYFDDLSWSVRYLLSKTDVHLGNRHILVSPIAIGDIRREFKVIEVQLLREQIKNSPPVDIQKPISRSEEAKHFKYYHWPLYWESTRGPGHSNREENNHLRSVNEGIGYTVTSSDGDVGRIGDFIIDTRYWVIRYLEVNTGQWWHHGRHILVNPAWIECVNWSDKNVLISLTGEAIESAPDYKETEKINRGYEVELFKHYGRRGYWQSRSF